MSKNLIELRSLPPSMNHIWRMPDLRDDKRPLETDGQIKIRSRDFTLNRPSIYHMNELSRESVGKYVEVKYLLPLWGHSQLKLLNREYVIVA